MRAPLPYLDQLDPLTSQIFIEGTHYGSFSHPPWLHYSLAYLCPHCGEVWARLVGESVRWGPVRFIPLQVSCRLHPDEWSVPGSLLYGRYAELLESLPAPALRRELIVHLEWAEKGQES